jgi:diacylglycerol kinase family enzyme
MEVCLSYDGGVMPAVTLTGLVLSNSRYVGPFLGFPAADLADGVFHSMELRSGRLGQTAHNFSSLTGLRLYEPVTRRDVRAVRVELSQPALLKIDGELRDAVRTLDVTILPGAVTVRVPAAAE